MAEALEVLLQFRFETHEPFACTYGRLSADRIAFRLTVPRPAGTWVHLMIPLEDGTVIVEGLGLIGERGPDGEVGAELSHFEPSALERLRAALGRPRRPSRAQSVAGFG